MKLKEIVNIVQQFRNCKVIETKLNLERKIAYRTTLKYYYP